MEYAVVLLNIALVNVAAWLTPGPNMIGVMNASLTHGRRAGLVTGYGIATGSLIWAVLAVVGVSSVFEAAPHVATALRLVGAAYLIWLGYGAIRSALAPSILASRPAEMERSMSRAYRSGFLISATNPKAALFFGSVLTTFLPISATPFELAGVVVLCAIIGFLGHTVTATVFSTRPVMNWFERFRRRINALFGVLFLGLGASVAQDTLRRL